MEEGRSRRRWDGRAGGTAEPSPPTCAPQEVYNTQEESWKENLECPWSSTAQLLTDGCDKEN